MDSTAPQDDLTKTETSKPLKTAFVAKEDFCYTHYDGDEARDMTHMNRLERGAYTDIRLFQRKVGHLSLDQIKKVLSKDFEECWPAIELVMIQDEAGKYYIEWLENSMQRAKSHSAKQSENGKNGGRPPKNKPNKNPDETQIKANDNPDISQKKPLGDEDGNEDEEKINENGVRETQQPAIVPAMVNQFKDQFPRYLADQSKDYPAAREIAEKLLEWESLTGFASDPGNSELIKRRWGEIVLHISAHQHYREYDLSKINKYFQSIVQSFNNGTATTNRGINTGSGKPGTSEARIKRAGEWGK